MDYAFLAARVMHIGLGVFWAGTLVFNAAFLLPALREAGPNGAAVSAGLMRRRFLDVMPVAAALTIISGMWLYWRVSAGFAPGFMGSPAGMVYGLGAVAAVIAFGIGVGIMRPAMLKAAALTQGAAGATGPDREGALATAQALRLRAAGAARGVAWLLASATLTMAIARYV
jgi:hypothetical protein